MTRVCEGGDGCLNHCSVLWIFELLSISCIEGGGCKQARISAPSKRVRETCFATNVNELLTGIIGKRVHTMDRELVSRKRLRALGTERNCARGEDNVKVRVVFSQFANKDKRRWNDDIVRRMNTAVDCVSRTHGT